VNELTVRSHGAYACLALPVLHASGRIRGRLYRCMLLDLMRARLWVGLCLGLSGPVQLLPSKALNAL
jgi:hypothetical protein